VIHRADRPIALDASSTEPVWDSIEPLPASVMLPDPSMSPSERTEFRLAHDGAFLYFSCRAYDSDPEAIQVVSLRRDERGWGSDRCGIYLDTMKDGENSLGFITTPSGTLSDFAYRLNAPPNVDWDAFWESAVAVTDEGWHAVVRIPFTSLLFQFGDDGSVTMGVSLIRAIARKNERIVHPRIDPRWGDLSHTRPSEMRTVVFHGVEDRNEVLVSPYALGGGNYRHTRVGEPGEYRRTEGRVAELGLDVRYGLTSNLSLDLSVNTDFAQVEADEQQVNLSRFGLFFPEKRRFFQERGAIFEYSLGGQERLFHSRQIGLVAGQPVPILGGARVVGRIGRWDVGALNMHTQATGSSPSENLGTVRFKRQLLNANSYAGGILTSRISQGGGENVVVGLDTNLRLFRYDDLLLNVAHAHDRPASMGTDPGDGLIDSSLFRISWTRPGQDEFTYGLGWTRSGAGFEPRMGFLQRRGYQKLEGNAGYGWRLPGGSRFRTYGVGTEAVAYWRTADQSLESLEAVPKFEVVTRATHGLTLAFPFRYENLPDGVVLGNGIGIPAGSYGYGGVELTYRASQGSLIQAPATVQVGQFFDGWRTSFSVRPTWNLSRHLGMASGYGLDHVRFPDRGEDFTAHTGFIRADVMFSRSASALAFVQYNSAQESIVANVRLVYRPREGNSLYIVWNEGLNTTQEALDGLRPFSDNRTLLIKYSHTLLFAL